jgi:predicted CoA-substrate-specific enzyme activase
LGLSVGMDVGSAAVKLVAVGDEGPVHWTAQPTRPDVAAQCQELLGELGRRTGERRWSLCSTGYGRRLVPGAHAQVSEIVANAVGAGWLWENWGLLEGLFGGEARPRALEGHFGTVIDVGGQDSKIIALEPDGLIRDFAMNDRCAAGTGRFLEVMARVLGVDLVTLDEMALRADEPATISSACTVFAESEVISLLAEGTPPDRVAAGVFGSVADQVAALAAGCRWEPLVLLDGGPAASRSLARALGERLGACPAVPPCAQLTTALGAAMLSSQANRPGPSAGRGG